MNIDLQHGDCLELMKAIPDKSIDMILCDLPYGVTARNKWDEVVPFDKLWEQYNRIIKDNGAIVLFGSGMFTAKLMLSNEKYWRYNLIWQKTSPTGFLNANRMPLRSHEDICVFYKKLPVYNPQKTTGHVRKVSTASQKRNSKKTTDYGEHGLTTYDSTERFPTSVLTFPTDKQKCALHPTQKPVALLEWLIKTYTSEEPVMDLIWKDDDDGLPTVLDNTMGSGSTGVACINTNRNFIGMELDDGYFEIAKKRIEELKGESK